MKSATILLVAVAVFTPFLQCSSAPNPPNETSNADVIKIPDSFRQLVYQAIDGCKDGLAKAKSVVAEALPKATGDTKNVLTVFNTWLYDFLSVIIDVLPKRLIAAMDSGSVSALKQFRIDNANGIDVTIAYMVGFNKTMPAGEVRDDINVAKNQVLYYATLVGDAIEELLSAGCR